MTPNRAISPRGVILAGGQSSRFEGADDKALVEFDSAAILEKVTGVVSRVTGSKPVLAVRTVAQYETYTAHLQETDFEYVLDDPDYEGPVAGILSAANTLATQWLFCCGCDMPCLDDRAVLWLLDLLETKINEKRSRPDAFALRHPDGAVEPLHTLYNRESLLELRKHGNGVSSPRDILSALPNVYTVPIDTVPDGIPIDKSTININTVDELATLRDEMDQ